MSMQVFRKTDRPVESGPRPAGSSRQKRLRRRQAVSALWSVTQFIALIALLVWLVFRGAQGMQYNWQWQRVPNYFYKYVDGQLVWGPLVNGLLVTLNISFWSLALTVVFGLATALLRLSRSVVARWLARAYLEVIRNTPLLVQLYVCYFVLAAILDIDRYFTGVLCLALFGGAYASEIFRAGILSVPRGQWEAASSLGLSTYLTYRRVILPQAVRIILPPMTGQAIAVIKSSAMVSVIAVFDLTTEGRNVISDTFMTFEIWLTVAAMYLVLTTTLSAFVTILERHAPKAT